MPRLYAIHTITNDQSDPFLYDINKSRTAIPDKSNRAQEIIKINDNARCKKTRERSLLDTISLLEASSLVQDALPARIHEFLS